MELLPPDLAIADAADHLHGLATELTAMSDFGGADHLEGLGVLLHSYEHDADLSEQGRQTAAGLVLTALIGRLFTEAGKAAAPAWTDVSIERPILVLGLPRTGTTALHHLLAQDPANQGMELWLAQCPMPRPPRHTWADHPVYQQCDATTRAIYDANPELLAIHPMAADTVDECWNLLRQSFASVTFECTARVTGYARWWAAHDMTAAYRRWLDNLRLIGSTEPQRRWVCKDPSHLFAPETLLATVPDATIVMTHRDPVASIPSVCSLNAAFRAGNDRRPDDHRLGAEQLKLWARGIDRTMAARAARPELFVDVTFESLRSDPLGVVRTIYAAADTELTVDAEQAMTAWLDANPRDRHGEHHYSAARFGLEADEIRDRFSAYCRVMDL